MFQPRSDDNTKILATKHLDKNILDISIQGIVWYQMPDTNIRFATEEFNLP